MIAVWDKPHPAGKGESATIAHECYGRLIYPGTNAARYGRERDMEKNEKLEEAKNSLATIIKMIDDRGENTKAGIVLDLVRAEAVDCLDRIRED